MVFVVVVVVVVVVMFVGSFVRSCFVVGRWWATRKAFYFLLGLLGLIMVETRNATRDDVLTVISLLRANASHAERERTNNEKTNTGVPWVPFLTRKFVERRSC